MVLGIDIGGTRTKLGLVNPATGELLERWLVATPRLDSAAAFLQWLEQEIRRVLQGSSLAGMGVGIAGFVTKEGVLVHSPNIPILRNVPLQAWLAERFPCPVVVDNDANVAAWAEYRLGAACDVTECLYVTIGTGVGGAIILNGQLWRGTHGGAGELGHLVVDVTASGQTGMPPYRIGVLEEYVGQAALLRCVQSLVRKYPASVLASRPITMEAIAEAYASGDEAAQECITWVAWVLGLGIASAVALLDITVVVVGGGTVEAFPGLLAVTQATLRQRALPVLAEQVELRPARFGTWAGVIGAALLVQERQTERTERNA
jgi:glucokinase